MMYVVHLCVTLLAIFVISATVGRFLGRGGALLLFIFIMIVSSYGFKLLLFCAEQPEPYGSGCSALGSNIINTVIQLCQVAIETGVLSDVRKDSLESLMWDLLATYGGNLDLSDAQYVVFRDSWAEHLSGNKTGMGVWLAVRGALVRIIAGTRSLPQIPEDCTRMLAVLESFVAQYP
jgi:hypothetical protein